MKEIFLSDIQQEHFEFKSKSSDENENYENFIQKPQKIVNKHGPLKFSTVRGNNVSFMKKNWRKAIYERTRLKNMYNKNRSRDNCKNYERKV